MILNVEHSGLKFQVCFWTGPSNSYFNDRCVILLKSIGFPALDGRYYNFRKHCFDFNAGGCWFLVSNLQGVVESMLKYFTVSDVSPSGINPMFVIQGL